MDIAILGAGNVGGSLGMGWAAKGHNVFFGVPDPDKPAVLDLVRTCGGGTRAGSVAQAAAAASMIVLAVPWAAVQQAVAACGDLRGKLLIDCTNPLSADYTRLALGFDTSGAELVAGWAPGASVFKSFNQTGWENADARYAEGRPVMFVCGDDEHGKPAVLGLVGDLGYEAVDAGRLDVARLLEPYGMLWIHLAGARKLGRNFAFGLLRR